MTPVLSFPSLRRMLVLALLVACNHETPAPAAPASGQATQTTGAAPDDNAAAQGDTTAAAPDVPSATPAAAPAAPAVPADEGPLPDLLATMRAIGWATAEPQDVAMYVPVPPAAEGQAGQFGSGPREVGVVLIRYPNERYAQPHVLDIEERLRLQPAFPEAIARQGRLVVHVRAQDRALADETLQALVTRLGWSATR